MPAHPLNAVTRITPHTAYKFGWLGLSTWWLPLRRGNEKPEPTHPLTQEQVEEILGRYQA